MTPDNQRIFLYDSAAYAEQRFSDLGKPIIQAEYTVYLSGNKLVYVNSRGCGGESDPNTLFFLRVFPVAPGDLPKPRASFGFDRIEFVGSQCIYEHYLPHYEIRRIVTGQYTLAGGNIWETGYLFNGAGYESVFADLGNPVIESNFDIYLDEKRLMYTNGQRCDTLEADDLRFFLHVFPVDRGDLPRQRKGYGFANLDFYPKQYCFEIDDRAFIERILPAYEVAKIRTGQYTPGEGRLWEGVVELGR